VRVAIQPALCAEPAAIASAPATPNPGGANPVAGALTVRPTSTVALRPDEGVVRAPADRSAPAAPRGRRFADLADFVEWPCNALAITAARQVCKKPDGSMNPFFVYGAVGTGKTHLLEGMYRQLRRSFPDWQILYLTSEQFTNYFTQAYRDHTLPAFRQRFRTVDVLIVDDVDFLDAKRVIQEEFLHTFKQLESHGKQVIVSGDRHPRLLTKISDELRTRFLSGMVCRLEPPDAETREKIVVRKASRLEADFSPEALRLVAERFVHNVRELEGALHCLQTYHGMTGKRITATLARQVLSELERDCIRVVRLADIERVVCGLFGVNGDELKSSRKSRSLCQPRMLAMYLSRKLTRAAYAEIGAYYGGRNHATVISAEHTVSEWLARGDSVKVAANTWPLSDLLETLEQQLLAG
jgi:chromosomal replication initiator protein